MRSTRLLGIVMLLTLAITLTLGIPIAKAESDTLSPSKTTLNLVLGSAGSGIHITYSGSVSPPSGTVSCNVSVSFFNDFGLRPKYDGSPYCSSSGYISIPITFDGAYNGKEGTYRPISSVTVKFYDVNGTLLDTKYLTVDPITINKIELTVSTSGNPISGSLHYAYTPENPRVGQTIRIYTSGDVNLVVQADQPPDVDAQLQIRYYQSTTGSNTKPFTITAGSTTTTVTIENADISAPVHYQILSGDGSFVIAEGDIDLPSYTSGEAIEARFVLMQPYSVAPVGQSSDTVTIYGGVYVLKMPESASLSVTLQVGGNSNSTTVDSTGMTIIQVTASPSDNSGQYSVVFNAGGQPISFNVDFTISASNLYSGGLVTNIFYYTFMVIIGASFTAAIAGFFLRRPDLMSSVLLGMASSVLVFMIPTLMAYALSLLFATGVSDPAHVGNINMMTLGGAIDRSVEYTVGKAIDYANSLKNLAIILIGLIAALAGLASGVGIVGWLTGGALSQFIGKVAGEFGAQLIMMAVYSFLAGYMLEVLAYVYPIVLNVVLIILFFTVVLYAVYAAFTGNIGQVYGPIIQFSILILAILLVPPMLQSIDDLKNTPGIGRIEMPFPINKVIDSIPNPFFWIAASLMQIVILVTIMYMAFQRMVAILGGGGGG